MEFHRDERWAAWATGADLAQDVCRAGIKDVRKGGLMVL